jgi:hypothetical protein
MESAGEAREASVPPAEIREAGWCSEPRPEGEVGVCQLS